MTSNFVLDWLALAVSLHNTILLLWLGLTVFLNADRRTWGIIAASLSLLFASAFFFSHSAILGLGLNLQSDGLDFWWHLGWIPIVVLPFAWYAVVLWYGGYWDEHSSALHRRQRPWLYINALLTAALVAMLLFTNPLPSFAEIISLEYPRVFQIGGVPVLLLAYLGEIFLCIALSMDVLVRPHRSPRVMGDLARRRAHPWLVSAAIVLLAVGLGVAGIIFWITTNRSLRVDDAFIFLIGALDLIIAALIAIAILLIGQAIALYEIFTGRVLPRRGLVRRWHNAVILALGFSFVTSLSLSLKLHPIYNIFLATALVTIFYALYAWRSYVERDQALRALRPFVTTHSEPDPHQLFDTLCRDVLSARTAFLVAVGPRAPLVPSLAHPDAESTIPNLPPALPDSPQTICVPLDPTQSASTQWAVPLWSERGLVGVLMLGEKDDNGIYSQEEIEIARASGERLIDMIANAELAKRLTALQRERIAETQILDQRARRILHDDVLPQLHAAMLTPDRATELLSTAHHQISDLLREMPPSSDVATIGLGRALGRAADDVRSAFERVSWDIAPETEEKFGGLASMNAETVFFAAREVIRNAARHSRAKNLWVRVARENGLTIQVEDDGIGPSGGAGVAPEGVGQGLALHSAMMAVIGGSLKVEPREGGGTRVSIKVCGK